MATVLSSPIIVTREGKFHHWLGHRLSDPPSSLRLRAHRTTIETLHTLNTACSSASTASAAATPAQQGSHCSRVEGYFPHRSLRLPLFVGERGTSDTSSNLTISSLWSLALAESKLTPSHTPLILIRVITSYTSSLSLSSPLLPLSLTHTLSSRSFFSSSSPTRFLLPPRSFTRWRKSTVWLVSETHQLFSFFVSAALFPRPSLRWHLSLSVPLSNAKVSTDETMVYEGIHRERERRKMHPWHLENSSNNDACWCQVN